MVDDGSTPPGEAPGVRRLRQSNQGPGLARNSGAALARGQYLVFTDDDCLPEPGWLHAFDRALASDPGAMLGGAVRNDCPENIFASFNQALADAVIALAFHTPLAFFTSNNLCVPATGFHALGGFSLAFPLCGGEDRDLGERWKAAGLPMRQVPDALILHRHPQNWAKFCEMHYRYGCGARILNSVRPRGPGVLPPWPILRLASRERPFAYGVLWFISQMALSFGVFAREFRALARASGLLLLLTLTLSVLLGALGWHEAEFAAPDEAAHLVSGIMVSEYLREGLWRGDTPLAFATQYYAIYPKVAIGHWPPVFYLVEAFWFLLTGLSRTSILLLASLIGAALGVFTYGLARLAGLAALPAVAAALATVLMPQTLRSSLEFGSDPLTALLAASAALACHYWLANPVWLTGLPYALLAALAGLTKGNAFPVLLLPALGLRRSLRFWAPALLAVALIAPWYFAFRHIVADEILPGKTVSLFWRMVRSAQSNALSMLFLAGPPVFLLALRSWFRSSRPVDWGFPLATWLFLSFLSPHTESRLMLALLPFLLVSALLALPRQRPGLAVLLLLSSLGMAHWLSPVRSKPVWHISAGLGQLTPLPSLIVSNGGGEGAWISESALRNPAARVPLYRASKLLVSDKWMGGQFQLLVDSPGQIESVLAQKGIRRILLHLDPARPHPPYWPMLQPILQSWQQRGNLGPFAIWEPRS